MQNIFDTMPPIDAAALERKLLDTVLLDDNYLFWRRHIADDVGWPMESDPKDGEGWDTYCTRCKAYGYIEKTDAHPKNRHICPCCGANIKPAGWRGTHRKLTKNFVYYHIQRGAEGAVWMRALCVSHVFGEVGEEYLCYLEEARYRFASGTAEKYTSKWHGAHGWGWGANQKVTPTKWIHGYYDVQAEYPVHMEDDVDLQGTCLAYAAMDIAKAEGLGDIEYLALYVKHPHAVEALVKLGFYGLLKQKLWGSKAQVNRVVNFRATNFKKLFRGGMHGQEIKLLVGNSVDTILQYRTLRDAGAARADAESVQYAKETSGVGSGSIYHEHLALFGGNHKEMRKYYERQARKSGLSVGNLLGDHRDYLRELDTLRIADGVKLPHNLHEMHQRLSERIRTMQQATEKMQNNPAFRVRRRLLRWAQFHDHDFIIRPIDSHTELIREGEQNQNCVASYATRHKKGETAIFVLRRRSDAGASFCTVEYDEKTNTIVQCRTVHNGKAPEEAWAFCDKWLAHLQKTHFDKKPTRNNRRNAA